MGMMITIRKSSWVKPLALTVGMFGLSMLGACGKKELSGKANLANQFLTLDPADAHAHISALVRACAVGGDPNRSALSLARDVIDKLLSGASSSLKQDKNIAASLATLSPAQREKFIEKVSAWLSKNLLQGPADDIEQRLFSKEQLAYYKDEICKNPSGWFRMFRKNLSFGPVILTGLTREVAEGFIRDVKDDKSLSAKANDCAAPTPCKITLAPQLLIISPSFEAGKEGILKLAAAIIDCGKETTVKLEVSEDGVSVGTASITDGVISAPITVASNAARGDRDLVIYIYDKKNNKVLVKTIRKAINIERKREPSNNSSSQGMRPDPMRPDPMRPDPMRPAPMRPGMFEIEQ